LNFEAPRLSKSLSFCPDGFGRLAPPGVSPSPPEFAMDFVTSCLVTSAA
jgi:hypothetical protein